MKLWAAATVGLYALILLVLTTPLLLIFYSEWWGAQGGGLNLKDALTVYKEAGYWIWLGIHLRQNAELQPIRADADMRTAAVVKLQ